MKTTNNNSQFSSTHSAERTVNSRRQPARLALLVALMLVTLVSVAIPAAAQDVRTKPEVKLSKLAGAWQATFVGEDLCGIGSALVTFTLNSSGVATNSTWQYHSTSCGDGANTGLNFTIDTLNADGNGTATLNVSESSKITLTIQVSPNSQVMNMVDITDANHYLAATAIKQ